MVSSKPKGKAKVNRAWLSRHLGVIAFARAETDAVRSPCTARRATASTDTPSGDYRSQFQVPSRRDPELQLSVMTQTATALLSIAAVTMGRPARGGEG